MDAHQFYMAQRHHPQYKLPTGQQDPAYDTARKNQRLHHPLKKLPDLAYDMEKNNQQRHHTRQKLSTYYQTMHISEVEYMMNDPEVDCQFYAFIDSKIEYQNEDEEETQQKDIDESVQLIPCPKQSVLNVEAINGVQCMQPLICLADYGSTNSLMNKSSMPYGVNPIKTVKTKTTMTQGTYTSDEVVFLNDIVLPEFVDGRHVQGILARLFDSPTYLSIQWYSWMRLPTSYRLQIGFQKQCWTL